MFTVIFLLLKNDKKILTSKWLSETFVIVFYAPYRRFWEQWLIEILSYQPWESIVIDVLFYGHHWEEPCLTQISILKSNLTSNARFDSVENSSPNPHQNSEKSQLQDIDLE